MTTKNELFAYMLTPLSWVYGAITGFRNKLFDWGVLPQTEFDVPVVSVGNIAVGGTGKTPMVEYIVRSLAGVRKVGVLSRGYKRKTKGFILANSKSTPDIIGDEPYQIYQKFGKYAKVAVCENRRKGISRMLELHPDLELIVLDDAFQHRYVKPRVSILLTDYSRPVYNDKILPLGHLRESRHSVNRADFVVVTKCPADAKPIDYRLVTTNLNLMKYQKLYFSRVVYGHPEPVFPEDRPFSFSPSALTRKDRALLVTGVANPRGFIRHFKDYDFKVKVAHFPDHHNFTKRDIEKLTQTFSKMKGARKVILTTEKDATRLVHNPYYPEHLKPLTFFIPISIEMIPALSDRDSFIEDLEKEVFRGR